MHRFDLSSFLPYQLAVASARVNRDFSRIHAEFGLTLPEWRVLVDLTQHGDVSVREIYQNVDMDKSKVSRAAARLEASGLITKTPNESDRRLISIKLTSDGEALMAKMLPIAKAYHEDLLAQLGREIGPLKAALDALTQESA